MKQALYSFKITATVIASGKKVRNGVKSSLFVSHACWFDNMFMSQYAPGPDENFH